VNPNVNESQNFILSTAAEYLVNLVDIKKLAGVYQFFLPVMPPLPHLQALIRHPNHVLLIKVILRM
jgi:hypothetical protein